jgi:NAD+ synthetase
MINYSKFVENSRKWLSQYIKDNHLQSIIIGISGGIDSTVSCAIAFPVCEELNIPLIGRSLPCSTNKGIELDTAELVGNAFCNNFLTIQIEDLYNEIRKKFEYNAGGSNSTQRGNIKARLRMMFLRHLASVYKGVVLDNDNFTEWNLGFWTVGGDSPMDINLGLHYLWKTEVYELADYLCTECMESTIPIKHNLQSKAILESMKLIPTDGNGVSNSDCEQFGLDNYEQVDDVLKTVYYNHYPNSIRVLSKDDFDKEYIRLIDSYNEQGVDKVMMLHQNTAYKRKELPIKPTREELGL